jgi:FMN phosphatase YigB (HAD superfamily)
MSQFVKAIFFDLGMTLVSADTTQWNPGAQTVITELRTEGLRLGIISNTGNLTRPQLKNRLPSDFDFNDFDAGLVLLSSEVGIEKPSQDIFRLAVNRVGAPSEQCLYCSEDFLETLAAQRAGMMAARIHPPPASDLRDLVEIVRKVTLLH